jgi:hypothetical protein
MNDIEIIFSGGVILFLVMFLVGMFWPAPKK